MPIVLAIETATKLCSVAVGRDGDLLALREDQSERLSHAEKVNLFAGEVLAEAGLSFTDIDAIAVGIGPGSYTGSRIGVSAAKGWSYALNIPIIGITTLRTLVEGALASGIAGAKELWPMIDARRMEVFTQPFSAKGKILGAMEPVIIDQAWIAQRPAGTIVFGDGADKAVEFWNPNNTIVHLPQITASAKLMLKEADRRMIAKEFDDLAYLVPSYGKPANVTQPKNKIGG